MKIYEAVVSKGDKPVAVLIHSPDAGRVVVHTKDAFVQRPFDVHYGRSIITHTTKDIGGQSVAVRRRTIPKDMDYLHHLLDKVVKLPYAVTAFRGFESEDMLDTLLQKAAQFHLEKTELEIKEDEDVVQETG